MSKHGRRCKGSTRRQLDRHSQQRHDGSNDEDGTRRCRRHHGATRTKRQGWTLSSGHGRAGVAPSCLVLSFRFVGWLIGLVVGFQEVNGKKIKRTSSKWIDELMGGRADEATNRLMAGLPACLLPCRQGSWLAGRKDEQNAAL